MKRALQLPVASCSEHAGPARGQGHSNLFNRCSLYDRSAGRTPISRYSGISGNLKPAPETGTPDTGEDQKALIRHGYRYGIFVLQFASPDTFC